MSVSRNFGFVLSIFLFVLTACSKPVHPPQDPVAPPVSEKPISAPAQPLPVAPTQNATAASVPAEPEAPADPCLECDQVDQNQDRTACFKLRPGKVSKNKKGKTVTGRCEPQSITYARCRSGIMTCRLGDTSPVEWFHCARKRGAVSLTPRAGSIMVIDVNTRHKMPTGHVGYVEEACPNPDGTWTLRFSHTNYDRKCHLDLDAKVLFNPKTMEANFLTGPWQPWAKKLKICGFVLS